MSNAIIVYKGRTTVVSVNLGFDVSADTLTSQIRAKPDSTSTLIATWTVAKIGGGTTGEITLTLDDAITTAITAKTGYMDIKRVVGSEPVPLFDKPLEVIIQGSVTA